jgi:uncharacterized protein involved in exopolysaccharide biosynthesis/Mrp family chromosome partitioning ATPase
MVGDIAEADTKYRVEKKYPSGILQEDRSRSTHDRPENQQAHLSDYLEILKRRKWIIISFFVLIVCSVSAVSFCITPQYEATAQILLGGKPTPMNLHGNSSERLPERNLYYQTQINLLDTPTLARMVINDLGLEKIFALENDIQDFLPNAIAKNQPDRSSSEVDTPIDQDAAYKFSSKVLRWYQGHLNITPVRDSSLVNVGFSGPDSKLITRIANRHAEVAINVAIERHRSEAKDTVDWLKSQIESQKKEVQNSQRAIHEFKKKHNILSLEDRQTINSIEIQGLSGALTDARSERIKKEAIYHQLKTIIENNNDSMLMPEISNYSVIESLRNQLVDLKSRQLELGTKYGPKHPKMIELNNRVHQIRSEIMNESKRLQSSIKAELDRAAAIENEITSTLNKHKKAAISLGERAIEYEVLKHQAESSQDIYNFLLKQSEQQGLASAISNSNMRIVERAEVPLKPVSPKISLNILLAIFLSLFVGTGLAFFLEYLDNTVKTPMDVGTFLRLPVLGMIPVYKELKKKEYNIPLLSNNDSAESNDMPAPLCHISTHLPTVLRKPEEGLFGKALIVESVTMGEGKSTVISRIATNLTEAGLRVLLVDCDFQRPSLNKIFKVADNVGGLGKSIDRIMAHHFTQGTLNEYSVDDLFFLISLKKKTGNLLIRNEDQAFSAYFNNGVLIHIQDQNSPVKNRIGTMLVNGGFITKNQLDDALQRHQRTGQPLGYILVNAGYIGRDKLKGPLRLQNEEYIQKVFSWKKGFFAFKPGIISAYENEKIFFGEDYTPLITSLGRIEASRFIEKELFLSITMLNKDSLYLLPAGNSHKLIGNLNQVLMKKIFEKLRRHFDVVLIDSPPLDSASGIESIFSLVDAIVLVIKAGHLSVKILNGAINNLPQDKILGTILNQAKVSAHSYYY